MRPRISIKGSVHPSVGPSICRSVCQSVRPSIGPSVTRFFFEFAKSLISDLYDGYKVERRHMHAHKHAHTHTHTHTHIHTQMRSPQWIETARNRRIQFIDKNPIPMNSGASEWVSERANKQMSTAERASEASSAEKANEGAHHCLLCCAHWFVCSLTHSL